MVATWRFCPTRLATSRSGSSTSRRTAQANWSRQRRASLPRTCTSTPSQVCPGAAKVLAELDCPQRQSVAARLGARRRRLFVVGALVSLLAPLLPYLSGAWETIWFALAAWPLPLPIRAPLFLLGFHLALAVIGLPLAYYSSYVLSHAFGLGRQTRRAWSIDWLKGALLGAVLGSLVGGVFLWTVVATGPNWWWVFGLFASALGLLFVFATPYVLVPIFFKMQPLADTATVERIHALVNRAGVPVRDVCSLDFSRRTAEANAAVIGLGRSRRVGVPHPHFAQLPPPGIDALFSPPRRAP